MIDNLFTGNVLGHESDIADGRLRGYEFRSLNNIVGDYYVAPKFLEAVAVCIPPHASPPCLNILLSQEHLGFSFVPQRGPFKAADSFM